MLPTGKRIEFNIASADVIHSFWVPEFLYKRDVMPFPEQNSTDPIFQIARSTAPEPSSAAAPRCAAPTTR